MTGAEDAGNVVREALPTCAWACQSCSRCKSFAALDTILTRVDELERALETAKQRDAGRKNTLRLRLKWGRQMRQERDEARADLRRALDGSGITNAHIEVVKLRRKLEKARYERNRARADLNATLGRGGQPEEGA